MSVDRPLSAHEQQDRMFGGSTSEPSSQHRDVTPADRPDSELVTLLQEPRFLIDMVDGSVRADGDSIRKWATACVMADRAARAAAPQAQPTNREDAAAGNVNAIRHVAYAEGYRDGRAAPERADDRVRQAVAEYREKLRQVGGMDNEMVSVPAGGVRNLLDAIDAALGGPQ